MGVGVENGSKACIVPQFRKRGEAVASGIPFITAQMTPLDFQAVFPRAWAREVARDTRINLLLGLPNIGRAGQGQQVDKIEVELEVGAEWSWTSCIRTGGS